MVPKRSWRDPRLQSQALGATLMLAVALAAGCGRMSPTQPSPTPTPPPTPVARTTRTRYLAFGDSLTAGTMSPSLAMASALSAGVPESYPYKLQARLAARYAAQDIRVENEGKPAETAADGALRLPGVLTATRPEVVILLHGVNDVSFLGLRGVEQTAAKVNTMARDARLSGAQVVICTLPPQRPGGSRAADPAVIGRYNELLRDVARGEAALLADFDARVDRSLIGVDGVHPTEAGYDQMAETLFSLLRTTFEAATVARVPRAGALRNLAINDARDAPATTASAAGRPPRRWRSASI